MKGWTGNILRIDLSNRKVKKESFGEDFARKWLGGRGMAVKTLWDELKAGTDPLSPENKFIVVQGPLSGFSLPNAGKTVVAARSPLTGGYGDGNLGSRITAQMRRAGYDMLIFEGRADKPSYVLIQDDKVEFLPADEIWGKGSYDSMAWLEKKYGKAAGVLTIGQAGEKLVKFAVVRSMEGRAGGRPGMGAVMGSKNLKAIVALGSGQIPAADAEGLKKRGTGDLKQVGDIDKKTGWSRQGTTGVLAWCNEVAALPVHNMRRTHHPEAWRLDGQRLEERKVVVYGCPNCTMHCGIAIHDTEKRESELDYENVGMLGTNLDIFDYPQMACLNYLCDDYGLDTISAGGVLGFYADAIEQGAVKGDFRFGDFEGARKLLRQIAHREGVGDLLAEGSRRAAEKIGNNSIAYAIQVKGLEISAYNCKFVPGMALAFGTSPIGAHHKEAWVITFEINQTSRDSYGPEKAQKVIELQRIRGGLFEAVVSCRFPWIELGWKVENYADYLKLATGIDWTMDELWQVSDRIYAMIKAFYAREFPDISREVDYPPAVWFDPKNADTEGPIAGKVLDRKKYDELLSHYYRLRGWDERGVPTRATFEKLGLAAEAKELAKFVKLT